MPPKNPLNTNSARVQCRWNDDMEDKLIAFLIDEVKQGKRADNSFKAKTWNDAALIVNAVLPVVSNNLT